MPALSRSVNARVWAGLFAAALALRLLYLWEWRESPLAAALLGDARAYDQWARSILAGSDRAEVFYQAPLYPYFLAAIYAVGGAGQAMTVRLVQAGLGAASCVLLGLAGERFFGRRTGLIAAAGLALWPSAIFADGLLQKSSVDIFLVCALLLSLVPALAAARPLPWLMTGVILGALTLTRENALALVPFLWLVIGWRFRSQSLGRRAAVAGVFLCGIVLALSPAMAHNWRASGELHLTTAQLGPNLFIGNNPDANGLYRPLRPDRGDAQYERVDATALAEQALQRRLSPGEVSAFWRDRAFAYAREQPQAWLRLLARKAALWLNRVEVGDAEDQYTYAESSKVLAMLTALLSFGVLAPLAVAGVVSTWGRRRDAATLACLLGIFALSVVVTYVMGRYRHPALPLLLLFAAAAVEEVPALVRSRAWPRFAVALALAGIAFVIAQLPLVSEANVRSGTLYNLGRVLQDRPGQLVEAAAYYRRAIALSPGHALAYNNLGTVLQRQGRLDDAVAALQRAVELRPDRADYHYSLGGALATKGDLPAAATAYERTLALDPGNSDAHKNLGVVRQQRGELDTAEREYRLALELAPADAGILNNLGALYAQQRRFDEAIASFRAAASADARSVSARENLVTLLANSGRVREAAAEAEGFARHFAETGDSGAARAFAERANSLAGRGDGSVEGAPRIE